MWLLQKNLERQLNNITPSPEPLLQPSKETAEENTRLFHKKRLRRLTSNLKHRLAGPLNDFATDNEKKAIDWLGSVLERSDSDSVYYERQYQDLEATAKTIENRFLSRSKANEAFQNALNNCYTAIAKMNIHEPGCPPLSPTKKRQMQSLYYDYKTQFQDLSNPSSGVTQSGEIRHRTQEIEELREEESPSATALEISRLEAKSKLAEVASDLQRKLSEQPFAWYATTREKAGLEWVQSALSNKEAEQSYYERQIRVLLVTEDLIRQRMDERTRAIQLLTNSFQLCEETLDQIKAKSKRNIHDRLYSILHEYQSASEALQQNACKAESADDIELITQSLKQLYQKFNHDWTVQSGDLMESTNSQTAHMVNGSCGTDLKLSAKKRQLADLISRLEQKVRDTATPFATSLEKMGLRGIQAGLNRDESLDIECVQRQLDALHELASTIIYREIARQNAKEGFRKALVEFRKRLFQMTAYPPSNTVDQMNRIQQAKSICAKLEDRFEQLQAFEGPPKNDVNIASLTKAFQDLTNELWIKWNEVTGEVNPSAISGTTVHHTNEAFERPICQTVLTLKQT
ncbi:hypothetical protein AHF37_02272 [Paragonimus kellicotti]|nr:hypothetical protein AHF37_02272 [Paragonimus kellicotti]